MKLCRRLRFPAQSQFPFVIVQDSPAAATRPPEQAQQPKSLSDLEPEKSTTVGASPLQNLYSAYEGDWRWRQCTSDRGQGPLLQSPRFTNTKAFAAAPEKRRF
ncbi:hypothetical protein ACP275_09G095400 [Erythranthe tilingii]